MNSEKEKRKPGRPSTIDSRKNEILEKAAWCFTMKGYNDTTLDEIGDSLGFNKAALYYYFRNKEDLFTQVVNYERSRLWELAKRETEVEAGLENKLLKYFSVRTEMALVQIKLNELSRSNILEINDSYNKATASYREREIEYLFFIVATSNREKTKKETLDFIELLINVQSAMTMSAFLLKDIENNVVNLAQLKLNKIHLLKHLLNAFQTSFSSK